MREFYKIIVFLPFVIMYAFLMDKCTTETPADEAEKEHIECLAPSAGESPAIARPHTHL